EDRRRDEAESVDGDESRAPGRARAGAQRSANSYRARENEKAAHHEVSRLNPSQIAKRHLAEHVVPNVEPRTDDELDRADGDVERARDDSTSQERSRDRLGGAVVSDACAVVCRYALH